MNLSIMVKNNKGKVCNMYQDEYKRWLAADLEDADLKPELAKIEGNDDEIKDRFAVALKFGTAGLRGVLGAGTNRMNIYVVRQATQGLANWVKTQGGSQTVAISYDSRLKSDIFAKTAAGVLAANGIKVRIYDALMPVPALSFATRYYECNAGIMVTASHNPAKYNGYKAYGPDGCQMTDEAAGAVLEKIGRIDIFDGVKVADFAQALGQGKIQYIKQEVIDRYLDAVESQSIRKGICADSGMKVVYTPLNGAGNMCVRAILDRIGIRDVVPVKEQELPDGNFPTCPYPNPEIREAMALGMEYAKKTNADLLLATDPDCDRVGIAVRTLEEDYRLLSGNEVGLLLLDYICAQRVKHGKMPENPVMVKTIVTMDLAERIAAHYGVKTVNVLTGFKFIGEQIGLLEKTGRADSYIFGFEESYGYLTGSYVRDKDGVDGAYMICEMFSYYKTRGVSLLEKLEELYGTYGYCLNTLHSYEFDGSAGFAKMQSIMASFREKIPEFGGKRVKALLDYSMGLNGLPRSDVLKFLLEDGCSLVVRPSGTEPKLKLYASVCAENAEKARETEKEIIADAEKWLA